MEMDANDTAANLCKKANALGLDNPTEGMISNCLCDVIGNLTNEIEYITREKDAEIALLRDALERMPEVTLTFKSQKKMKIWIEWRDKVYTPALKNKPQP